ncbi:hypothetical protein B9Z55_000179 [Caenorhabditis nigoni]|uniref:DUF38 domain-containing protein n=2 Tax=Caenorhabditis nigoni TaxID=1611254 RepID=A0A2G5VH87_9PELO|nr:hypothetical protein B9Z55_000179 [Caenorhabditis nigoni]
MKSKPMTFCDTKTVLTYMEASSRFNIALKIPSIRKAEKAAPLHINRLELEDNRLVVNDTVYILKVYRECQAKTGLSIGEVDYDFDEQGFKISIDESIQHGDIKLAESGRVNSSRGSKLDELGDVCPTVQRGLPCDHRLRLYVSGSMRQFPYTNMKMYQLMKRLLTNFLGNRGGEWTIKNMSLQDNVLRWPVNGRRPIVRNVNIYIFSQRKINALHSIIDSSVPLTSLKTTVPHWNHIGISNHPLLKNVEHLIFTNHPQLDFFSDLFSIQTQNVSITTPITFALAYHERLISKFMEKTRPIGLRYSIVVKPLFKRNLTTINVPNVIERSTDSMKLAMGNDAVVVVQYTEINSKIWLNIETVPKKK